MFLEKKVDIQLSDDGEKCPHCGSFVKKGMRFCTACGKAMVQPAVAQPAVVENAIVDKAEAAAERSRPECGAKITDAAALCTECGA